MSQSVLQLDKAKLEKLMLHYAAFTSFTKCARCYLCGKVAGCSYYGIQIGEGAIPRRRSAAGGCYLGKQTVLLRLKNPV